MSMHVHFKIAANGGSDCGGDRGMLIRGRAHRSGDTGGAVLSSCGDRTSPLDGTTRRSNVLDKKRRQREVSAAKAMTTSDGDGTIAMVNLLVKCGSRSRLITQKYILVHTSSATYNFYRAPMAYGTPSGSKKLLLQDSLLLTKPKNVPI